MKTTEEIKLEILNYIFKSKDGASWNEVSEMLNELVESCIIKQIRHNEIGIIGSDIARIEILKYVHQLEGFKDREIIILNNEPKTLLPETLTLKDEIVYEFTARPTHENFYIDKQKLNEPWYRKFENKKRRKK
jgi:hypothetical protein